MKKLLVLPGLLLVLVLVAASCPNLSTTSTAAGFPGATSLPGPSPTVKHMPLPRTGQYPNFSPPFPRVP